MRIWLIVLAMLNQLAAPQFPQAELSNSSIRATLYLPDAQQGYYRGTRFDWSGAISSLKWLAIYPRTDHVILSKAKDLSRVTVAEAERFFLEDSSE